MDYYPLSQVEGLKGKVISKSTTTVKFNSLYDNYQEIANLQNKIYDFYSKLFGNLDFNAVAKKIDSIYVTPTEELQEKMYIKNKSVQEKIKKLYSKYNGGGNNKTETMEIIKEIEKTAFTQNLVKFFN